MSGFDDAVLLWLNGFAGRSRLLDTGITELARSDLVKGVPLAAVLLAYWFATSEARDRRRAIIVATFGAAGSAIVLGRLLAHFLPFRVRPIHDPTLGLVPPYGGAEHVLRAWSAFPSDHAMLFVAMATGILFLSRRVGVLAHLYAAVFIFLPRIYLGWHHPSDVLGGAALGATLAHLANLERVRVAVARPVLALVARYPGAFHAAAFVVVMQVATMFGDVRSTLEGEFVHELRAAAAGALHGQPPPAVAATPGAIVPPGGAERRLAAAAVPLPAVPPPEPVPVVQRDGARAIVVLEETRRDSGATRRSPRRSPRAPSGASARSAPP